MGITATRALRRVLNLTFTQAHLVALRGLAASHPSPGVQLYEEQPQVPRGDMVIFRGNKTYISFSLAVGWGQLYCPVIASTLSETECRGRSGSISFPTPLSTKLWCCRGKEKKKKRICCSTSQTWTKPQLKPRLNRPVLSLLKIGFI